MILHNSLPHSPTQPPVPPHFRTSAVPALTHPSQRWLRCSTALICAPCGRSTVICKIGTHVICSTRSWYGAFSSGVKSSCWWSAVLCLFCLGRLVCPCVLRPRLVSPERYDCWDNVGFAGGYLPRRASTDPSLSPLSSSLSGSTSLCPLKWSLGLALIKSIAKEGTLSRIFSAADDRQALVLSVTPGQLGVLLGEGKSH